ncbi:MFS transporter [Rathayibacter soli]|uniref:MFS transporter n=1 Tax=Rathayibacter soli TaxID=3144168 RepID=UPI0027E58A62|nr:MFS transporter [Glaciibacter superstes]
MPDSGRLPLWHGRSLALLAILLIALNLRSAVAALSPIIAHINADIPLNSVDVGVLGMLPPICFAVFGFAAPFVTRRLSLEATSVLALAAMLVGDLLRAAAGSFLLLVVGSVVVFAGMGVGNVLLPPLVKRYFPDRIGLMTSLYVVVISISTFVPPLVAVPIADAAGWRISVGVWALVVLIAFVPFVGMRRQARIARANGVEAMELPIGAAVTGLWRSSIAWSIMVIFTVSSINVYALFAWLPAVLTQTVGASPTQAGILLSLYAAMGLVSAIFVPMLATRMKNVALLVYLAVAFYVVGYLGLIFIPGTATWLWVALAGLGPLTFPLALALINVRTRTHEGSVALSGFVQGVGYIIAAMGPLLFGVFHQFSGGWTLSIVFLLCTALAAAVAGVVVARPHMLEDRLGVRRD